ncbi:MAG: hypothetical protein REI96_06355 [Flavobacterium nitrogenifigens]|uniref:hypothetical protein n=1 Tax=Flavobacterium nitrogenifigens TaxID=1617283 RepID=UPI002807E5C6|nr:hypothetical protein [Flavobacterium nitrogenifigens]MDQ8012049.1 hypothetical protein [Flavobacterium nitrogenifigens]
MRIISGQSLSDIAVQEDGNVSTVLEWALKNNKSITEKLVPGNVLENPKSDLKDIGISQYFNGITKKISTGITNENYAVIIPDDGIGAMIIEDTFIVR